MNVQGVPQVTDAVAKVPPACDFHRGVEGHGEAGHQQVCHSQTYEEIVVDLLQLVIPASQNAKKN